ncbi:MAG: cation-translocating P-type ATPase [Euryarchaeota archaeon]|nr:cation-translocating P-type ATPase [Euryarchaeota archaeon]
MNLISKLREEESFRTLCLTAISGIVLAISFFDLLPWLPFDAAWIAIVISGIPIVYGAVKGVVMEYDVTADLLVAIALVAAVAIGEYFVAGEVAFIMQLGKVLEDVTAERSHRSLQALIKLTPQKARVRTAGVETEVLAKEVKRGDVVIVRPGEAIPVDGVIVRGSTSVNQAVMTGESVPVDRNEGDGVYQGTLNQQGAVEIRATSVGDDSSLRKMIRLVEEAEKNKAPIVRIADRWARVLVPVALGCALVIWFVTGDVGRAVTALVVFCPCSLILATPTAMMATIGNATRKGILIKSGAAVEAISKVDTFVIDKTGTLTCGVLQVAEIEMLDPGMDRTSFVRLIASAEMNSEHPLGKAIVAYGKAMGISVETPESFEMHAGKGVTATVAGRKVSIGEKVVGQAILDGNPHAAKAIDRMQKGGKTALPVALDGEIIGIVAIADTLRKEAKGAVAGLKEIGMSRVVMLTGDNQAVADSIGREAGVTDVYASQLPEDKVNAIKSLLKDGHKVAMLGDGVNDAPALATASVGVVMGAIGSDVSMEAADIALMSDDVGKLPFLVKICRKARSRIVFNIVVSMFINFGAIVFAAYGFLNPVTAAIVHNCGSVFVVVNSAMLLTYDG